MSQRVHAEPTQSNRIIIIIIIITPRDGKERKPDQKMCSNA